MATGNTYIHSLIWVDGPIKAILQSAHKDSHLSVTAYLYIYTNEATNSSGLFRLRVGNMAEDLGIPRQKALEVMATLTEYGLIEYDHDAGVVWVISKAREVFKKVVKANDHRVKEVRKTLDNLPPTRLKQHFLSQYPEFMEEKAAETQGASKGLARASEGASSSSSQSPSRSCSGSVSARPAPDHLTDSAGLAV